MSPRTLVVVAALLAALTPNQAPAQTQSQTQIHDVIYMKAGGAAFTMDVLKPTKPNRAAVIFMISGAWISDQSMLPNFTPGLEKVFVDNGFTVFEVLHGAQPRYKVAEIVDQVQTAVRFVHTHASDYGIDTNRVGVSGISSGGHLALMIAGSPDSPVNAVAAIAPPTDLANWGKPGFMFIDDPKLAIFIPAAGIDPKAPREEFVALAKKLSPITYVNAKFPPTLIVQGDSDQVVPPQQAQAMSQALANAGVDHKLDVIPGGGHDDKTFGPGLLKALQWFQDKLLK
jgi:acetyl esterase/lipase